MSTMIDSVKVVAIPDEDPDLTYLEFDPDNTNNAARLASYGDTWECVGVQAQATIKIQLPGLPAGGYVALTEIQSPGLWGIETDSEPSYFQQVGLEELDTLRSMLHELNVTDEEIDRAFEDVDFRV